MIMKQYLKRYPMSIYLICMLCIFLFVYDNYYFNITKTKYTFFSSVTLLCATIYLIRKGFIYWKHRKINKIQLSKVDILLLLWLIVQLVSVVISQYPMQAISGSYGRQTGLIFSCLCVLTYWMISRSTFNLKHICILYLGACCILHILAILNFFSIDPLGFYIKLSDYQSSFFISTTGNINFYASIICLSLPISFYLYIKLNTYQGLLLITIILGFFGLLCSNSDSGYLGIGCMFLYMLFYSSKQTSYLKKCLRLIVLFLTCGKLLSILSMLFPIHSRLYYTLSAFFTDGKGSWILWVVFIGIYVIVELYEDKLSSYAHSIRIGLIWVYGIVLCIGIFMFIYCSFIDTNINIGFLSTYFRWNAQWGTGRAKAWMALWEAFKDFSYLHKLFGFGPDTTRLIMQLYYGSDTYLIQYDNAHNEYLQYLMTTGIIGLCSYIFIFAISFYRVFHYKNVVTVYGIAITITVGIYLIQACVNINQPISTPLLFVCLGLIENSIRGVKNDV